MPLQANRLRPKARSTSSGTMDFTMPDELAEYLDALARDDCYRVDAVLKDGALETTQRVFFVGANGAEQGPYVRKYLDGDAGLGAAYERIWKAQRSGSRFLYLPRIVDCYAAGEQRAVVMEYVQGETLADVVYRCDPSTALACDVFPKLCEAVSELHDRFDPPLIHRDLKPSNIMMTSSNLTIIDFGISRSFDDGADEDTRHFGTRAYAPPEQFGYGQTDVRSDVYALGMLLYFCLTERTPDAKARKDGFVSSQIPDSLRQVIMCATAFDPAQRYASVSELRGVFDKATSARIANIAEIPQLQAQAASRQPTSRSATMQPSAHFESRAPRPAPRKPLRIGVKLGIVWDVILVVVFSLFVAVSTSMVFDPKPTDQAATASLVARAFMYYPVALLMVGPLLYFVSDRRPLRHLIPRFANISRKRELLVCSIVFVAGVLIVGIAGQFVPPYSNL